MTVFQLCSIASALLVCTLPVASAQGSPRQNVQAAGERTEAFTPMVRVTFANGVQANWRISRSSN